MIAQLQQDKDYNEVSDVLDAIQENKDKAPTGPKSKLEWDEKNKQYNLAGDALRVHLAKTEEHTIKLDAYTKANRAVAAKIVSTYCTTEMKGKLREVDEYN